MTEILEKSGNFIRGKKWEPCSLCTLHTQHSQPLCPLHPCPLCPALAPSLHTQPLHPAYVPFIPNLCALPLFPMFVLFANYLCSLCTHCALLGLAFFHAQPLCPSHPAFVQFWVYPFFMPSLCALYILPLQLAFVQTKWFLCPTTTGTRA